MAAGAPVCCLLALLNGQTKNLNKPKANLWRRTPDTQLAARQNDPRKYFWLLRYIDGTCVWSLDVMLEWQTYVQFHLYMVSGIIKSFNYSTQTDSPPETEMVSRNASSVVCGIEHLLLHMLAVHILMSIRDHNAVA